MSRITQRIVSERRIDLVAPKLGCVMLSKFSPDYDYGLYADRPWHVVTFGRNFATVEECISFVQSVVDGWDREPAAGRGTDAALIDSGYQAFARERGDYDLPDCA